MKMNLACGNIWMHSPEIKVIVRRIFQHQRAVRAGQKALSSGKPAQKSVQAVWGVKCGEKKKWFPDVSLILSTTTGSLSGHQETVFFRQIASDRQTSSRPRCGLLLQHALELGLDLGFAAAQVMRL